MSYTYELALVLSAKLADEKQKKIVADVKKYITGAAGKTEEAKLFGKKKFTYPIKKETEGFYYIMNFSLDGKETAPLNKKLTLNEGILRYLLIRK